MTELSRRTFVQAASAALATATIWTLTDAGAAKAAPAGSLPLDRLGLGNPASETAHGVASSLSSSLSGALSQPARVLNPTEPAGSWGGTLRFRMMVDPKETTYLSLKLWGEDFAAQEQEWRLQIFIDGKSAGWMDQ